MAYCRCAATGSTVVEGFPIETYSGLDENQFDGAGARFW